MTKKADTRLRAPLFSRLVLLSIVYIPFLCSVVVLHFIAFDLILQSLDCDRPQILWAVQLTSRPVSELMHKCNCSWIRWLRSPLGETSSVCGFHSGWLCSIYYPYTSRPDRPSGASVHESATSQLLFAWGIELGLLDGVFHVFLCACIFWIVRMFQWIWALKVCLWCDFTSQPAFVESISPYSDTMTFEPFCSVYVSFIVYVTFMINV